MAERKKHLFQFSANRIADAAKAEAEYHRERVKYWQDVLEESTAVVEKTAGVRVERIQVTGGWQPQVVVDYGDPAAHSRMSRAAQKIQHHQEQVSRFQSNSELYATQGERVYELDGEDVEFFRFNGRTREE